MSFVGAGRPMEFISMISFMISLMIFCLTVTASTPAASKKDKKASSSDKREMSSNDDKFKAKTNDEKPTTEVQEKMTRLDVKNDESATKKPSTGTGGGKT